MPLQSMTGFGRGEATGQGLHVVVEIGSVNRRQFDNQVSVPRALGMLEPRINEEIQQAIVRGRLTGLISLTHTQRARRKAMRIDEDLAATYLRDLRAAGRRLGLPDDLTLRSLLELPDLVDVSHPEADLEAAWPVVRRALRQALKGLVRMRRQEGQALEKDLRTRCGLLRRQVEKIRKRAPGAAARYRAALLDRIAETGVGFDGHEDRLLREVAIYADKCDISEEITRLGSHLDHLATLMRSREASGKALDFLAQEMFREINTIGAKANDSVIVQTVVGFKAELERIREQVQNIE